MYADDNDAGKLQIGIFTVFSLFISFYFIYIYRVFHNLFPLYLYVKYLKLLFKNYFLYAESARIIGIHRCNTLKYFQVFQAGSW